MSSRALQCVLELLMEAILPMRAPKVRPHDYYDRTGFHYIVLQGTVDCLGRVIDIDIQSFFFRSQVELTALASSGAVT